mmetsp:Transcript_27980/g.91499  ORF Transcript_27980/g.91499 Transcript_27980/m.91499 type:complete len:161 (+) Transcript_27980:1176-1658(+)
MPPTRATPTTLSLTRRILKAKTKTSGTHGRRTAAVEGWKHYITSPHQQKQEEMGEEHCDGTDRGGESGRRRELARLRVRSFEAAHDEVEEEAAPVAPEQSAQRGRGCADRRRSLPAQLRRKPFGHRLRFSRKIPQRLGKVNKDGSVGKGLASRSAAAQTQ